MAAPTPAAPPRAEPWPGVPPSRREAPFRRPARTDFATSLGPKILVGAGGLAVVVFLGLFVRYAWEHDRVGPLGRVVSAALFSLPLFYAPYALFAVTAAKVVLVDLATLPTLYRMLSFLALGVLQLAGAWLNLRFRERLEAPGPPVGA